MLSARRSRGRVAGLLLTALAGLSLGSALGWAIDSSAEAGAGIVGTQSHRPAPTSNAQTSRERKRRRRAGAEMPAASDPATAVTAQRAALGRALRAGQRKAEEMGGTVEAAVMAQGWSVPVVVGDGRLQMRMWSMAKPVTAVALHQTGEPLSREVKLAIRGALTRSENCAQRRVILELQRRSRGPNGARRLLKRMLEAANVNARLARRAVPPAPDCREYLLRHGTDLEDPLAPALLLGVSEWTVRDAVRFASALMNGEFGHAGDAVFEDMAQPKGVSREIAAQQLTVDPAFGAGKAIPGAAYKAGWGGADSGRYVAGQLGVLPDRSLAFAVMFHPMRQPASEDPGLTAADEAIQAVLRSIASAMRPTEP